MFPHDFVTLIFIDFYRILLIFVNFCQFRGCRGNFYQIQDWYHTLFLSIHPFLGLKLKLFLVTYNQNPLGSLHLIINQSYYWFRLKIDSPYDMLFYQTSVINQFEFLSMVIFLIFYSTEIFDDTYSLLNLVLLNTAIIILTVEYQIFI